MLLLAPAAAQDRPRPAPESTDVREEVHVELVQYEVSVWPKRSDDTDACRGLSAEDFSVIVNGRERRIAAVDWLGSAEAMEAIDGQEVSDRSRPPLSFVVLFDLWHLDLFYRAFDCPITKPLAFDQARRLVREEFRDGDRLLLATLSGWPQIHEGWIRNRKHALQAIDRLEVSPFVLSARRQHLHHEEWFAGLESLILALGRYPGRKEIFYMGDDFRFDDLSARVFDLAARAQSNQVSIHAVDLLASCRGVPGPGCTEAGGLGCTDFRVPVALGYLSKSTGGELAHTDALVDLVRHVRELRGCRYLISFEARSRNDRRAPNSVVRLAREDLQLNYPSSFGHPARGPSERERQDALFLLPRFGNGLYAEAALWPLRPLADKKKSWRGLAVARLRRAAQDPWPAGLTRLDVGLVVHKESRILGNYSLAIEGDELAALRDGRVTRLLVFPVQRIRPGRVSVALRVTGVGGDVSANVRNMIGVPEPPGPGQSGAWFVTDGVARAGDATTLLPVLDGTLEPGRQALLVGYGCRGADGFGSGTLRAPGGEASIAVPLEWLNEETNDTHGGVECGWIVGSVDPMLAPGLWRFEPPETPNADRATVEFRIAAREAPAVGR